MKHGRDQAEQVPDTNHAEMGRRDFLAGVATTITVFGSASRVVAQPNAEMYGEIGKIIAVSGKRDELIANILDGINNMPGVSAT